MESKSAATARPETCVEEVETAAPVRSRSRSLLSAAAADGCRRGNKCPKRPSVTSGASPALACRRASAESADTAAASAEPLIRASASMAANRAAVGPWGGGGDRTSRALLAASARRLSRDILRLGSVRPAPLTTQSRADSSPSRLNCAPPVALVERMGSPATGAIVLSAFAPFRSSCVDNRSPEALFRGVAPWGLRLLGLSL